MAQFLTMGLHIAEEKVAQKEKLKKKKDCEIKSQSLLEFLFFRRFFSLYKEKKRQKRDIYSLLNASMGLRRAAWTAGTAPKNRPTRAENTTVAATMYQLMKMGTPDTRDTM